MIKIRLRTISNIVVTSIAGHSGSGDIFPLNLLPSYQAMMKTIRENRITVIAKSATRYARKGHYRWWAPWKCIKQIVRNGCVIGLINSFGLTNKGVAHCAQKIKKSIEKGFDVIPSYFVELNEGIEIAMTKTAGAVEIYSCILGKLFWALEYNASCGNSGESLEENERHVLTMAEFILSILPPGVILIVKVSPLHSVELSLNLEKAGVHVIHALNSFPHRMIYPDQISPLHKLGGGSYSGEFMFGPGLKINTELRSKLRIPMIMGCGISCKDGIGRYLKMIARNQHTDLNQNSLAICSVIRTNSEEGTAMIEESNQLFRG